MKQLSSFLFIFVALITPYSEAASEPRHQQVTETAERWVFQQLRQPGTQSGLEVKATPVDERIQIPACAKPFAAEANNNSLSQSTITVKVHCPVSDWFLYVMVRVKDLQSVVVTTASLSPGTLLSLNHLKTIEVDKNQLRGTTYAEPQQVVGARVKRRIRSGDAITPRQLCFICEGDKVTILAKTGGLSIKTSGIAEQDGNIGDTIQVRNRRSERMVNARVISSAAVQVGI
ncbi:hypothetical protein HMF8227_00826 [Saliniradius amylolyticus]|uniref:Flagella basal body P-ring formation protein FlgA n=1 Tax=Saliniradius amylolyticus TaxID=2183582 RepID=A0A2S2E101_9ALTE|nr:flagellar basal body P-ring formation chaperone FlgA [Saliniradius amylolyticus]AWL11321.1 hypothetical protein HMF8227_00826 [Saliniradius amylolyticus]